MTLLADPLVEIVSLISEQELSGRIATIDSDLVSC